MDFGFELEHFFAVPGDREDARSNLAAIRIEKRKFRSADLIENGTLEQLEDLP